MSKQEEFRRPENLLEKTWVRVIDVAGISKEASKMKRKFKRNQKCITLRDSN